MIPHAVNNITIWNIAGLFSSEFKYASYYICMASILDGSVIVVSLITSKLILLFIFSDALQQKVLLSRLPLVSDLQTLKANQ